MTYLFGSFQNMGCNSATVLFFFHLQLASTI